MKLNEIEEKFEEITGINFNEFYRKHKTKLIWHLTKYTNDQVISEDFADEAFIQALNKIEMYNPKKGAQVHTWVYTIAENLLKRSWNEEQRLDLVSLDRELAEDFSLSDVISYNGTEVEDEEMRELCKKSELLQEAILGLPEKYKKVLIMRELDNKPYQVIADTLDINLSTIKSQIKKGRTLVVKKVERKFKKIDEQGLDYVYPYNTQQLNKEVEVYDKI